MSNSKAPVGSHHQDYLARIRYSNALPPPPWPPKLLHIPGTGLTPRYTSAAYLSHLFRRQPLNIEVDAELGMPIDLVGLPGVFEDDNSYISARNPPPPIDPADLPLLRNPRQLGTANTAAATFLRKNEQAYAKSATTATPARRPNELKRKRPALSGEIDPKRLKTQIARSFVLANPAHFPPDAPQPDASDRTAWATPQHPTTKSLHLLDTYPIHLDFDNVPMDNGFLTFKFNGPPLPTPSATSYDPRTDHAVFRAMRPSATDMANYTRDLALHAADPSTPAPKQPGLDYEMFAPASLADAAALAAHLRSPAAPAAAPFKLDRVRTYETERQYQTEPGDAFTDNVAVALEDGEHRQKGAYLLPLVNRVIIRPRRARGARDADDDRFDQLHLAVREPLEAEREAAARAVLRVQRVDVEQD